MLADRRDRVWTIRLTQWIGCVQASLLAILVVSDAMTIEILFALVLMLGIASGVAQPSRLALIPTLVDRESLASALAINSVIFNLARFIGPALAGIVIAEIGIAAANTPCGRPHPWQTPAARSNRTRRLICDQSIG